MEKPLDETCTMYLVRHGATDNNLADPPRLQGRRIDGPLCPEGLRQAQKTSQLLAGLPFAAIYASPLGRARQTADILAQPHRLSVQLVPELAEVDVGQWENHTWQQIAQQEPEAYGRFQDDPGAYGYRGGETLRDVLDRATPAIEQLAERHLGGQILVVGHSVVNRTFLGSVLGLPFAKARAVPQDNCAVNVLHYRRGQFAVVTVNSVLHLREASELPSAAPRSRRSRST